MFKFELGVEVKDTITGWSGIIIVRVEYLGGNIIYYAQPKGFKDDDTWLEGHYIDECRLELVDNDV